MIDLDKLNLFTGEPEIRKYLLKKKDLVLAEFDLIYDKSMEVTCKVTRWEEGVYPYGFIKSEEALLKWLRTRFVPKNRRFVDKLMYSLGTELPELIKLLDITFGLSLTDDYWILPERYSDFKWDEYNLYRNDFSEVISNIAFTGYSTKIKGLASSPEFTTNGMLKKSWRRIEDKVYLYKGGTDGYANAGNEPYSEFYASQVLSILGFEHVSYDLEKWKGSLCSTCELFTSENKSFVNAYSVFGDMQVTQVIKKCIEMGFSNIVDMFILDVIIMNEDRHFGNFGFIRNNGTGKLEKLSPLFDHGLSLLVYGMEEDLLNLEEYLQSRTVTSLFIHIERAIDFVSQFLTPKHKRKIRRLLDFEFSKHDFYNLADWRLNILSEVVRRNARELLKG